MARMTLGAMLEELRAEVGASLSPGHNLNQTETQYYLLRRTERELYAAYDWPHLITEERFTVTAGTRYIGPFETVDYEQINEVYGSYGSEFQPLMYGVTPDDYLEYDPETGDRGFPVCKYRPVPETEEIELWPIPSQDITVIVRGQMKLSDMKNPDDKSTLDGTLIVLFAAADLLSSWDRNAAAAKAAKAANFLRSLRTNLISQKKRVTGLTPNTTVRPRPGLDYIPEGWEG